MKNFVRALAISLLALAGGGCVLSDGLFHGGGPGYPGPGDHSSPGYGQRFRCESDNRRQRYCSVDTRGGVRMTRQLSSTPCMRGRNWDYDRHGVWVSHGCRAEFIAGAGDDDGYYGDGSGYGRDLVRCESRDNRQRRCNVAIGRGVELVRQLSRSRCVQGSNWGWDRGGIWVDRGCRADFRVY